MMSILQIPHFIKDYFSLPNRTRNELKLHRKSFLNKDPRPVNERPMSLDINETRCGICQDLDSKNDSFTFEAAAVARSAKGGCATCDILSRGLVHARPDFLREVGKVKAEKAKDKPMTLSFLIKGSPSQESVDIYSHAGESGVGSPNPVPSVRRGFDQITNRGESLLRVTDTLSVDRTWGGSLD